VVDHVRASYLKGTATIHIRIGIELVEVSNAGFWRAFKLNKKSKRSGRPGKRSSGHLHFFSSYMEDALTLVAQAAHAQKAGKA